MSAVLENFVLFRMETFASLSALIMCLNTTFFSSLVSNIYIYKALCSSVILSRFVCSPGTNNLFVPGGLLSEANILVSEASKLSVGP